VLHPTAIQATAFQHGFLLGDWYQHIIEPAGSVSVSGYTTGTCPRTEEYAQQMVNLPTHHEISPEEAQQLAQLIRTL
jgi:dTDP-4-amino-4,6-dideoxygalactose transaminase